MKNIKLFLAIVFLCINSANAISTSILQVSTTTSNMYPGKIGIITLSFLNAGTDIAYDTRVVLKSLDIPLNSDSVCNECKEYSNTRKICYEYKDYCYNYIGDIYGSNVQETNYKISIPDNIKSGAYIANFDIHYSSKNTTTGAIKKRYINKKVVIIINNTNVKPDINIDSITMPKTISPGDIFNLTINLKNYGEINAKNVKLKITTTNFKVIGSTNEKLIGNLNSTENSSITYTLVADPSLNPGAYELGLTIYYSDDKETYTTTSNAGIIVDGKTSFDVFIQSISPDILIKDAPIEALISIANTGMINAKSVSIKLNNNPDILIGNVNHDFLGDLDTGDFTTTNFKFIPKKEGEITLNLTITYLTPSGNKISFNSPQRLIIRFTKKEAPKKNYTIQIIASVIISLGIGYLLIKNKRKRK